VENNLLMFGIFCQFFVVFFANFYIIEKKLFPKVALIVLVLDTTSMPHLTFLSLLSPEISFGEKTVTQPP